MIEGGKALISAKRQVNLGALKGRPKVRRFDKPLKSTLSVAKDF
jgi:hypothetical protein